MARIIILSIPDNAEAEDFARWMLDRDGREDQPVVPPGATIEAMVARPTVACRGPHRVPGKIKSQMSWTRTVKFGWWVCGVCKKPAATIVRDFVENMLGGHNDLLPTVTGGEPRPPKHLRSVAQGGLQPNNKLHPRQHTAAT
jgi:hypothetical protein